jgi:cell division protein FtsW
MLVIGLGLLITSQAMLHILVNVGILPVTGHTLPLISLGGTSLIIMSAAFGIILSVSRTIEVDKVVENEKKENNVEEVVL